MKWLVLAGVLVVVVGGFSACGGGEMPPVGQPGAGQAAPTDVFTPIVVQSTPTPLPPPPTRTPRPTSTAAPTAEAQPTSDGATAQPTAPPAASIDTPLIEIPAGSFEMGSTSGNADSQPPHMVEVAAFMIDEHEVSNADFRKFVDATGHQTDAEKTGDKPWSAFAEGKEDHPVVKVSWTDARAFCEWAGKRLPTEAEWEYAARGTDGRAFPWGNEFDPAKVNGKDSGLRGTTTVASYPAGASPFGVLDMAGNVWEWTSDIAEPYPGNTTASRLYGSNNYILRGGGWFDVEEQLAAYYRNSGVPTTANDDLGFRCAR